METWLGTYRGQVPDEVLDGLSVDKRTQAWREWLAGGARAAQQTWVGLRSDEIVGFANAGPSRDPDGGPSVGEVYAIYVLPAHWDTGAGAELMRRAAEHLVSRFDAATLWVLETNERARRFYEKGGWSFDGTSQPLDSLGGVIEVRYRIDLTAP